LATTDGRVVKSSKINGNHKFDLLKKPGGWPGPARAARVPTLILSLKKHNKNAGLIIIHQIDLNPV
jgi:hypothetical protein